MDERLDRYRADGIAATEELEAKLPPMQQECQRNHTRMARMIETSETELRAMTTRLNLL